MGWGMANVWQTGDRGPTFDILVLTVLTGSFLPCRNVQVRHASPPVQCLIFIISKNVIHISSVSEVMYI